MGTDVGVSDDADPFAADGPLAFNSSRSMVGHARLAGTPRPRRRLALARGACRPHGRGAGTGAGGGR